MLDRQSLEKAFSAMGIRPGMHLMVHSSLSRFGYVVGGADAVLDALMALLTPEGTLMLPSFNHNACYDAGELFDICKTPTTNGIIADTFWQREGVLRSINPTHSFAAWGKNAVRYTQAHHKVSTMGQGSPLHLLMQDGGYCLLLGVGYHSNTFHHCVEMCENVPCLGVNTEVYPMSLQDGSQAMVHTWGWRNAGCPLNDAAAYAPEIAAIHTQQQIGEAVCTLYPLKEGYKIIAKGLHKGIGDIPGCQHCPIRPRVSPYTLK